VADDPLIALLARQDVPFLAVGREPGRPDLDQSLDTGTEAMTTEVLDHLFRQGAHRVALLAGTDANAWNVDSETTYRTWAAGHGQPAIVVRRPETAGQAGGLCTASPAGRRPGCSRAPANTGSTSRGMC
jgi:DNA-binding LacI/PurR family transcriptional regulator